MIRTSDEYAKARTADFDCPFTVGRSGAVHLNQGTATPVPTATHDDEDDIVLDSDAWEVFSTGYTGQHGYNGGVMHASEQFSGRLLDDVMTTPGTYVITAVEVERTDDDPDPFPAGWTILKLKES